jgi:hypothetical protein
VASADKEIVVTPISQGFAAFRVSADRWVYPPCVDLWLWTNAALRRLSRAAILLPDRGLAAQADELPQEYFRFPPF